MGRGDQLIQRTAELTGITPHEITGEGKGRDQIYARYAVIYVASKRLGLGYPRIGEIVNRTDCAVRHALIRAKEMVRTDPAFGALTDQLMVGYAW